MRQRPWLRCCVVLWCLGWALFLSTPAEAELTHVVVVLPPVEVELEARLRGYVRGSAWQVEVSAVAPPNGEEPDSARAAGAARGAQAVLWFRWQRPEELTLYLWDPAAGELVTRQVPLKGGDATLARSAAYETAALIAGSMLERIADDTVHAEGATSALGPPPKPVPPAMDERASRTDTASEKVRAMAELGWRLFFDEARVRNGPRASLGVRTDAWWVAGLVGWVLPTTVNATAAGASEYQLDLTLSEVIVGAAVGGQTQLPAGFALGGGLGASLLLAARSASAPATSLAASAPDTAALLQLDVLARLATPPWWSGGPHLGLEGGLALIPSRPHWVVGGAAGQELPLDVQWAPLQPSLGLWIGWSPE